MATPGDQATVEEVTADFCRCAQWAAESSADASEANLSCPNVCSPESTIYMDIEQSRTLAAGIHEALGKTPLLIKVGHSADPAKLRQFFVAMHGLADGITMVNAISRPVLHRDGRSAFGMDADRANPMREHTTNAAPCSKL